MAPKAVRYLDNALDSDWSGFEWGSGRSTIWLGQRLRYLISIEHDEDWYAEVGRTIDGMSNVHLRHVPLNHSPSRTGESHYDVLPDYVASINDVADESLGVVLVDGAYRQPCVAASLPKIRVGGLLVIDNTDWLPLEEWGVPSTWRLSHQSSNVMTETTVWIKASRRS